MSRKAPIETLFVAFSSKTDFFTHPQKIKENLINVSLIWQLTFFFFSNFIN